MAEIQRLPRKRNLNRPAVSARRQEAEQVIRAIRRQIRRYGLTPEQLFAPDLADLVQYRDPVSGKTWNGHGRPPDWIRGQDRERYRVD